MNLKIKFSLIFSAIKICSFFMFFALNIIGQDLAAIDYAKYKDKDGDGRIDMAELVFDEPPETLPTAVVLTNPFDNSQKDTVYSDGISWLNDDPSTLTINIMLNKPFPEDQNTSFETGYYGAIIGGLYLSEAFEIGDGMAPVINTATYCPGEIIDIEMLKRAFDTLIVYFSEDVMDINFDQPFIFKTTGGVEYSFKLEQISHSHDMVIFKVIKDVEIAYPYKEDSIKINFEASISDMRGNNQDIEGNCYAKLLVKPKPSKLIVTALSPVNPVEYQIPDSLIAEGITIRKGTVIVIDFFTNLEDDAEKLECAIDIFGPGGDLVAECEFIGVKHDNLQIGIVEDYSTKLVVYWTGKDQNGNKVCGGTYTAELYITDHDNNQVIIKREIEIISDIIYKDPSKSKSCGNCGTSSELAFIPAIWLRAYSFFRKRKKKKKSC